MRWFAIVAMFMLAACAAEPEAEAQITSISGKCYSAEECNAYIERALTKAEILKGIDELLEQPGEIKKNLRREYLNSDANKIHISAAGKMLREAYTDEELRQLSERLKNEPRKPYRLMIYDPDSKKRPKNDVVKTTQVCSASFECGSLYLSSPEKYRKCREAEDRINNNPACNKKTDEFLVPISCSGVAQQGGAVLCQTTPNAKVKVARSEKDFYFESADENGQIIIGFDRDETKNFVEVAGDRVSFDLKPRDYDTSRIDGLPPSQVSTFSEAQLKRIRSSSARKKVGFSSRAKEMGFKNGFDLPIKAEFIKTTNFGAQRILNGEPKKPHYGVDLAAPVGTPIYAPADGIVSLADDDLYFEGAMVLLDHGQGLISMYLHTDEILVEPGQAVKQGEQIATVGSKGRSTGPHLCWRCATVISTRYYSRSGPKMAKAGKDCNTMTEVREGVDALDRELVALLVKRQAYMSAAGRIKNDRNAVYDADRIEDVVSKVLAEARKQGLSEDIAEQVWRKLIERCIAFEFGEWDKLRAANKQSA